MNTSLLAVVKQIVAEEGEAILADPKRLKPVFRERAKNEPPSTDKTAFGRCIELGAYQELKNARTANERGKIKTTLSQQLQDKFSLDAIACAGALDLLEAVLFPPVCIEEKIREIGGSISRGLEVAEEVGKETVKIAAKTMVAGVKITGTAVKEVYVLAGGTQGIQQGIQTAGKVAGEAGKIAGTLLGTVTGLTIKTIGSTIKEISTAIAEQRQGTGYLEDKSEYVDFVLMDDDDD